MKILYLFFFFLSFFSAYSQDIIEKTDGTLIESKINEIGLNKIEYYIYDNLSGPVFIISKKDVFKIILENGTVELMDPYLVFDPILFEKTKKVIVKNINEYGFEHPKPRRPYNASFEDDYLRLSLPNLNNRKITKKGPLLDLSKVYEFHNVSYRNNGIAFVNLKAPISRNKKRDVWLKYKLVIRVQGHDKAEIIMQALKNYNKLLIHKNK